MRVSSLQLHMSRRVSRLRREAKRLDAIGQHNEAYLLRARALLWYREYRFDIATNGPIGHIHAA